MSSIQVPFTTTTGISVSDAPIINLSDPVNPQDAATKNFASNANNIVQGTLAVLQGGTGATTASVARTNLGAAASGANSDITSLSGLTTALSVAQGGTGRTTIAGSSGQLIFNNAGAYDAASLMSYNGATLTVGASDGVFTIAGKAPSNIAAGGSDIVVVAGQSGNTGTVGGAAGNVYIKGGPSGNVQSGEGGSVYLQGGSGPFRSGSVFISTGETLTERLRITSTGAWGLSGANYGTNGQVLMSSGSEGAPTWQTLSGLGTVTSVAVSGGTTGLTTSGGPITTSGTITLAGTLAIANGGTGATTAANARTNLSAAASGANSDITSLSGLTTALSVAQGGTGGATKTAAFNSLSPATTKGDIIVFNGTNNVRLAAGSDGQVLAVDSTTTEGVKWAPGGGNGTVTSIAVSGGTTGLTTSGGPVTSSGTITLAGTLAVANGGTGLTAVPGSSGQLLMNSSSAYAATGSNLTYNGTNQLTVGGSPFTIAGTSNTSISITAGGFPGGGGAAVGQGGSINITGGSSAYRQGGSVTITGGAGVIQDTVNGLPATGGDVTLKSGSGLSGNGSLYFSIVNTERLRIISTGAWGLSGANYGTTGQVLTSNGSGGAPTWTTISSAAGTVTSVAVSGGTTGLTTSGGPITSSGTITLAGTLAIANGGTGATTASNALGNLFSGVASVRVGTANNTFSMFGDGDVRTQYTDYRVGANVTIQSGASGYSVAANGGGSGTLTLAGGDGPAAIYSAISGQLIADGGSGGDVVIRGGTGPAFAGNIYFRTGNSQTERLRIIPSGAWGLGGANYGTSGQVLTSNGSSSAPTWQSLSAGGTVTSVALSGGTTGLTVSGSPITTSGTLTLAGTLAVANGGTGSTTASGARTNLGAVNIAGDTMTGTLILASDPTQALHAATKQYVDNVASGLNVHSACRTSTTDSLTATYSNGTNGVGATLTGTGSLPTIGGVTLSVNDRVLVKNQTSGSENGIYVVTTTSGNWVLTRAADFDGNPTGEITAGDTVYIQEGTLTGTQWVMNTTGSITVGTTSLAWTQFGGPGNYTAGTGIDISSNVISNTGVTALTAGTNISVSGSTGNVTVAFSGTLPVANGGTGQTSFASGYLKSDGTSLSSSSTVSGADVSGNISGNAANVTGTVAVANGGTGATTAADARTNLSAAASGANSDITSLSGLTTALSIAQGGTGATTAADAANNLLPSQTGNTGKYLTTDGAGVLSWAAISSAGGLDFGTFEQPAGFYLDMGTF